jgi:hypothetical protein
MDRLETGCDDAKMTELHVQGEILPDSTSETLANFYQTTQCKNRDNSHLHMQECHKTAGFHDIHSENRKGNFLNN